MGASECKHRSQIRVSKNSTRIRNTINECQCKKLGHFSRRGFKTFRKRCYSTCTQCGNADRFLQYLSFGKKEDRGFETCNQFKTPKHVHGQKALQNGYTSKSSEHREARRLGILTRSERCILHVPVHPAHQKYLGFSIMGENFQFQAMCFGPTQAPRVFTKLVSVITAHLRKLNIRLIAYLDDWLVVNAHKAALVQDRERVVNLLTKLGFIINVEKSHLEPTQNLVYLGSQFNLKTGQLLPTIDRVVKLEDNLLALTLGQTSTLSFLKILGIMPSCIDLIPYVRLHMRPIQLHLLHFWRPSSKDLECQVPITPHLLNHFKWWLSRANTMKEGLFNSGRHLKS